MILGFTTQLNGEPTCFPEKILAGLLMEAEAANNVLFEADIQKHISEYAKFLNIEYDQLLDNIEIEMQGNPKYTTIRDDAKGRWEKSKMIDFYINVRKSNMFNFAPRIAVKRVQEVFMSYAFNDVIQISVDGKELFSFQEREQFAKNDGFDTWEAFFDFFYPKIQASEDKFYKGKLIQWTDLKY